MKSLSFIPVLALLAMSGCATQKPSKTTFDRIENELRQAAESRPREVERAVAPVVEPAPQAQRAPEKRFDLAFSQAPAAQVFSSVGSGSNYNVLVHPEVSGTISANLKNVTLFEALDALRELYGYDYRVQGNRVIVLPATLQSRMFQVNYLAGRRQGQTDVRVTSGSIAGAPTSSATAGGIPGNVIPPSAATSASARAPDSSRVQTSSDQDFWGDIARSLQMIVGADAGRSVVINSASGVILIKAMPNELQQVERFLQATQGVIERQVMLEAKIVEVELSEGFQSGINWANLEKGYGIGLDAREIDVRGGVSDTATLGSLLGGGQRGANGRTDTGIFGIAVRSGNFAALLQFLESQGNVQVLSSPRIATLNNQKAVLKVGTDEFFVTNVTTTTNSSSATTTTSPTITTAPFFSGIALDVTPQIDGDGNIILHIHPSISVVTEKAKNINLGQQLGSITLPLASSNVNETDSIVRIRDGQIVAIGGLMKQSQSDSSNAVPGSRNVPILNFLLGQKDKSFSKREVVIMLKPTVIRSSDDWRRNMETVQQRIHDYAPQEPPPVAQ
jgi:MSHA biogenesis protein MshL